MADDTTANFALRSPQGSTTPPSVPVAIQKLAQDVDKQLSAGIRSSGTTGLIAAAQTRSIASYGLLGTPDRVQNVPVVANGRVKMSFAGQWQESVAGAARAAIFIGANQLSVEAAGGGPYSQEALTNGGTANTYRALISCPVGLASRSDPGVSTSVTTGQALALATASGQDAYFSTGVTLSTRHPGGECIIWGLPAGSYDFSIQFKASSGSVTAKNRILWVESYGVGLPA